MPTADTTTATRFVSLEQAAEHSTLSIQTLRRAIRRKELRAYRPSGRRVLIDVLELDMWIHGAAVGAERRG